MTPQECGRLRAPIEQRVATIRRLNDAFRRSFTGGRILVTSGFSGLPNALQARFLSAVRDFDDFEAGNDPYAEHDFGAVTLDGQRVLWKLDYYGPTMAVGADDPSDASTTTRVLTIMLAHEY